MSGYPFYLPCRAIFHLIHSCKCSVGSTVWLAPCLRVLPGFAQLATVMLKQMTSISKVWHTADWATTEKVLESSFLLQHRGIHLLYGLSLVTVLLLDLIKIYRIQWIRKAFRGNSLEEFQFLMRPPSYFYSAEASSICVKRKELFNMILHTRKYAVKQVVNKRFAKFLRHADVRQDIVLYCSNRFLTRLGFF